MGSVPVPFLLFRSNTLPTRNVEENSRLQSVIEGTSRQEFQTASYIISIVESQEK